MKQKRTRAFTITVIASLVVLVSLILAGQMLFGDNSVTVVDVVKKADPPPKAEIRRLKPDSVKAVYLTMYTAGQKERIAELIDLAERTELNAMVIDVKGSLGELIFDYLDAAALIQKLHEKNIYTIARVVAFQDSGMAKTNPGAVIKNKNGQIWRDRRGFAWVDPASQEGREHIIAVSKKAIDAGFDEINYDYIRFPTDGKLDTMVYPAWDGKTPRNEVIKSFAAEARKELKKYAPDVSLSIDIFGYTFLRSDDLGIGQRLEDLSEEFDFVYPMVYPSHYSAGNFGFQNPAEHPYEVIKDTIESGLKNLGDKSELIKPKIRPWLQVFDLGAKYTPDMIKLEKKAVYDSLGDKSTGWLLWNPSNRYERSKEYLEK